MKKLFFLLLLLILSACAARRQSGKQTSGSEISTTLTETAQSESVQFSGVTDTEKNENTEIQIYIVRYDTSQPADPETGKPPVKEEEHRTIGKQTNEKSASAGQITVETAEAGKEITDNQSELDTSEKNDTGTDVAGGRNLVWAWIVLAVFTGIGILLRKTPKQ